MLLTSVSEKQRTNISTNHLVWHGTEIHRNLRSDSVLVHTGYIGTAILVPGFGSTDLTLSSHIHLKLYIPIFQGSLYFHKSHITLQPKTVSPLKLNRVEPGQYLDGRSPGKMRLLLEEVLVRPAGVLTLWSVWVLTPHYSGGDTIL